MSPVLAPLLDVYCARETEAQSFVIFDRDNTLIEDAGYTHLVSDLRWRQGALELLSRLHDRQIACFIATNQSGLARGIFTHAQMQEFHGSLVASAENAGGCIRAICTCPHADVPATAGDRPCDCRKPRPGLFLTLMKAFHLDPSQGLSVGDKVSDWDAAKAAGLAAVDSRPPVSAWSDSILDWWN